MTNWWHVPNSAPPQPRSTLSLQCPVACEWCVQEQRGEGTEKDTMHILRDQRGLFQRSELQDIQGSGPDKNSHDCVLHTAMFHVCRRAGCKSPWAVSMKWNTESPDIKPTCQPHRRLPFHPTPVRLQLPSLKPQIRPESVSRCAKLTRPLRENVILLPPWTMCTN